MLQKLYGIGIRDTKLLKIIQAMLESGVMEEGKRFKSDVEPNELGTPQGGLISPLLANVYLHSFDKWIAREWEEKRFKIKSAKTGTIRALKNVDQRVNKSDYNHYRKKLHTSNLKPANLIRYADDWVLITDTKENAEKWKYKINKYLERELKLELSSDKTLITNIRSKAVKAIQVDNLKSVHEKRNTKIPALKHQGVLFGLTSLAFANYDKNKHRLKDPKETPYSLEGRKIHEKRTGNKPPLLRADELLSIAMSKGIISDKEQNAKKKYTTMMKYNFEFYLNRARAYNRDKGKCRVCSKEVSVKNVNIHHESPLLPLNLVNKTQHLATVHETCRVPRGQPFVQPFQYGRAEEGYG